MTWREEFEHMRRTTMWPITSEEIDRCNDAGDPPVFCLCSVNDSEVEKIALRLFAEALIAKLDDEALQRWEEHDPASVYLASETYRKHEAELDRLWAEAKRKAGG